MIKTIRKLLHQYLNLGIRGQLETSLVIRVRLLNVLNISCLVLSIIYAWINSYLIEIGTIVNLFSILVNIVIYILVFTRKYITAFFTFMFLNIFIGGCFVILFGKYLAADLLFCMGIAYSIAMFENRYRVILGVTLNAACYILAMYYYENFLPVFHDVHHKIIHFYYPNMGVFLSTLFVLVYLLKNENTRIANMLRDRNKELFVSSKQNENLIHNILPVKIADELKEKGTVEPKLYRNVTVMFTDFYQFTKISEKMSALQLVQELDIYFKAFDQVVEKYGLEKLKTIGDAYMCASGIPEPREDHAVVMVKVALEIKDIVDLMYQERHAKGFEPWHIRIGINSGNVVAGIIGETKFSFDIWGDTVNTASRMESSGERGKINISPSTYALVKDQFICTHRGKISAKNKGELDMYFVEGER